MRQHKLKKIVIAAALAFSGVAFNSPAAAAGLGKLTVLSSLGQPLRAEIEVSAVTREEAASLAARLASPDAFRQAGIDYNPALLGVRFTVSRRAAGQYFINLASSQPINDPFLDLLVELNWASGRLVREYTFLLDPADMRPVAAPVAMPESKPAPRTETPRAAEPVATPVRPDPAPVAKPSAPPAKPASIAKLSAVAKPAPIATPAPAATGSGKYEVKKGDTLGKIARQSRLDGVSLDQMMIALLRNNPDAFVGGNINRLRSGVILNVPDKDAASGTAAPEARRLVAAQSADFKAYQDKLAGIAQTAPAAKPETAKQEVRGKITAKVDDKSQKPDAKDQLRLSKADPAALKDASKGKPKAAEEDKVAKERALKDTKDRAAELEKNVKDLQKLAEVKSQAMADLQKQAQAKPAAPVIAQGPVAEAKKAPEPAKVETPKAAPPVPVPTPPTKAETAKSAEPAKAPEPPKAAETPKPPEPPKAAEPAKTPEAPKAAEAAKVEPAPAPVPAAEPPKVAEAPKPAETPKPAEAPKADEPPKMAPKKPVVAPPPPPEPSMMDEFLENPLYLAGGGGVLALLGGYAAYAVRRKRKVDKFENSIITGGDLKANSVFGNTGGQSVDTGNSSFQSDFSQVGAGAIDADEVDPVAEADVYMAYGRDAQAEEILKEALQKDPSRQSVRVKLLEIYSQRADTKSFESHANELHTTSGGQGEHWARAVALGQALMPGNPLFGGGGVPADTMTSTVTLGGGTLAAAAAAAAAAAPSMESTMQMQALTPAELAPPAVDPMAKTLTLEAPVAPEAPGLDVDFDLGGIDTSGIKTDTPDLVLDSGPSANADDNMLDFDIGSPDPAPAVAPASDFSPSGTLIIDSPVALDSGATDHMMAETQPLPDMRLPEVPQPTIDFDFDLGADAPATSGAGGAAAPAAGNAMDFDLSAIDLDLPASGDASGGADTIADDAATKLDLAKAYQEMGDKEGAKELLQEVVKEGNESQKAEAQGLLAKLG